MPYNKRYFKVTHGYGTEDVIYIDSQQDLERAIYAFVTGKSARIGGNFIKGSEIKHIKEDWNRTMGYAKGYRLQGEDWDEIRRKGVETLYKGYIAEISDEVERLTKGGQIALIGQNREELPETKKQIQ